MPPRERPPRNPVARALPRWRGGAHVPFGGARGRQRERAAIRTELDAWAEAVLPPQSAREPPPGRGAG